MARRLGSTAFVAVLVLAPAVGLAASQRLGDAAPAPGLVPMAIIDQFIVPDVIGMSAQAAHNALLDAGFADRNLTRARADSVVVDQQHCGGTVLEVIYHAHNIGLFYSTDPPPNPYSCARGGGGGGGGGPPPAPTLSLDGTPSRPFTGTTETLKLTVGNVADATGSVFQVSISGANPKEDTARIGSGTTGTFQYVGRTAGTDTITVSGSVGGHRVSARATVRWLPGTASVGWSFGDAGSSTVRKLAAGAYADPLNTLTGNFYLSVDDARLPGAGVAFDFTRSYNSLDSATGPLGKGWTASAFPSLAIDDAGDVTFRAATGEQVGFRLESGGTFSAPEGTLVRLAKSGGGYALTMHDATVQRFDASGRFVSWEDENRQGFAVAYDGSRVSRVTATSGGSIGLVYSGDRLVRLDLPDGTSARYGYTGDLLASVTDGGGKTTRYGYDGAGRLATITDPGGDVSLTNRYDDQGRVVDQGDALGNHVTFDWSGDGVVRATDARGATWTDVYGDGKLTRRNDPLGNSERFTYDGAFNLTSVTDPRGNTTTMTYDERGNMTSRTAPDTSVARWSYDGGNRVTAHTDAAGGVTAYEYDAKGNLVRQADAAGNATVYAVDPATGLTTASTDPLGRTRRYSYDHAGNLVQTESVSGARTAMSYDELGRLTAQTDPLGRTTRYAYDAVGRLLSQVDPLGRATAYSYDPAGRLVADTDPNGHTTTHRYDAAGRKTADIAADGAMTSYAYDGADNLVSVTDPKGNATRYEYDALGRRSAMVEPSGAVWRYGYDAGGNQTSVTDPLGRLTTTSYDTRGRRTGTASPLGFLTRTDYDATGNVIATYDPRGLVAGADPGRYATRMTYDRLDRLVSTTDPLDNRTSYAYDAAGQLTARTDPRGNSTRYVYDGDGRLSSVSAPDGSITTYAYDAAAEMVSRTDPNGHVTHWSYDATGNLAAKTDPLGRQWSYRYDPAGQLVETRAPAGGTIARSYDAAGRVTGVSYSDGTPSVAYAYDPAGNRTQMQDGAGTTAYAYDANGRLVSQSRGSDAFSYSYDVAGRLVSRVYPGGFATSLDYDADGRLARASSPAGATLYAYDAAGNLLSTTFPNAVVEQRTYDAAGRILTIVGKRPASAVGLPDPTAMTSPPPRALAGTGNGGGNGNGNAAPQPPSPQGPPAAPESPTPGAPPDPGNGNGNGNGAPADPATPPTATAEKGNGQGNGNDRGNANGQAKDHEGNADSSGGESSGSQGRDNGQAQAGEGGQGKSSGKSGGKGGDKPTTDGEFPAKSNGKGDGGGRGGKKTCSDKADGKAKRKDNAGAGARSDGMPAQSCPKPKTLGPIITSFAYTYDSSGNPVQVVTPAGTETYRYDARDRLVEANLPSGRYVYGYDPVGNRLSAQTPAGLTTYVYDAADQLTRAVTAEDEISYTYDGSGNQATAGDRRYTYDLANRLLAVEGDGAPVALSYDGDGNLVSESSPHGTTSYLWDSNAGLPQVAVERDDEQTRTYGYGIALATLSVDDHNYVYLGDRLGSVAALTDEQTVVDESYRYDPYGVLLDQHGSNDNSNAEGPHELNRMLFAGQYLDPSTGLYNLRARNYEAADGRFLQTDPLAANVDDPYVAAYVYADDRPTVLVDPTGESGLAGGTTPANNKTFAVSDAADCRIKIWWHTCGDVWIDAAKLLSGYDDVVNCLHGRATSCAWVLAGVIPGGRLARVTHGLKDLAELRRALALGEAGTEGAGTLARLDVGKTSFYGINAHGQEVTLRVNPISKTHAETDVLQQLANAGGARGQAATLYVDRSLCQACDVRGAVKSMARQVGVSKLTVVTPSRRYTIKP